jgi:hypothetical protein
VSSNGSNSSLDFTLVTNFFSSPDRVLRLRRDLMPTCELVGVAVLVPRDPLSLQVLELSQFPFRFAGQLFVKPALALDLPAAETLLNHQIRIAMNNYFLVLKPMFEKIVQDREQAAIFSDVVRGFSFYGGRGLGQRSIGHPILARSAWRKRRRRGPAANCAESVQFRRSDR